VSYICWGNRVAYARTCHLSCLCINPATNKCCLVVKIDQIGKTAHFEGEKYSSLIVPFLVSILTFRGVSKYLKAQWRLGESHTFRDSKTNFFQSNLLSISDSRCCWSRIGWQERSHWYQTHKRRPRQWQNQKRGLLESQVRQRLQPHFKGFGGSNVKGGISSRWSPNCQVFAAYIPGSKKSLSPEPE